MSTAMSTQPPGDRRWTLTGSPWLYMLLVIPVVTSVRARARLHLPLTMIAIGLWCAAGDRTAWASIANVHRRLAEVVLGEPVPTPYSRWPKAGSSTGLRTWAGDPARWKDLVWMFVAITLGWVMAFIAAASVPVRRLVPLLPRALGDHAQRRLRPAVRALHDRHPGRDLHQLDLRRGLLRCSGGSSPRRWCEAHAWMDRAMLSDRTQAARGAGQVLSESRADTVDLSAAELRRIERDLHDGAQAGWSLSG